jgi:hypothetical protein
VSFRKEKLPQENSALLHQINTQVQTILNNKYIHNMGFGYDNGFAAWGGGLGCSVAHSDANARVFLSWIIPETRTDWKITMFTFSSAPRTASGKVYIGATADGESLDTTSIENGTAMDCLSGGGVNFIEQTSTSTFTATVGDYIYYRWEKDANDGAGTFYVVGSVLTY